MGELRTVLEDEGIMDDTLFVVTSDHASILDNAMSFMATRWAYMTL